MTDAPKWVKLMPDWKSLNEVILETLINHALWHYPETFRKFKNQKQNQTREQLLETIDQMLNDYGFMICPGCWGIIPITGFEADAIEPCPQCGFNDWD